MDYKTNKIIAEQAVDIIELKEENKELNDVVEEQQKRLSKIYKELHGICGLLNTNVLKFSSQQVDALFRISKQAKGE